MAKKEGDGGVQGDGLGKRSKRKELGKPHDLSRIGDTGQTLTGDVQEEELSPDDKRKLREFEKSLKEKAKLTGTKRGRCQYYWACMSPARNSDTCEKCQERIAHCAICGDKESKDACPACIDAGENICDNCLHPVEVGGLCSDCQSDRQKLHASDFSLDHIPPADQRAMSEHVGVGNGPNDLNPWSIVATKVRGGSIE